MAVLPKFENDIYISFRHNHTILEWVEEFVAKLKQELEATSKDDLNIYFLKQVGEGGADAPEFDDERIPNLKSLVFIPIISHTYCDAKNYCWQKEFLEFKEMANSDEIGLNIDLASGATVSRVLPVKIHNIDGDDIRMIENELVGNMRSVDFIYDGEEGVNRPLSAQDDQASPGNSLLYRNQINKTANAISELIKSIKKEHLGDQPATEIVNTSTPKDKKTVFLSWAASDVRARREELLMIMQKAGMNVIPITDSPTEDNSFKAKVIEGLTHSHCSVHILGSNIGRAFTEDPKVPFPIYQFDEANMKVIGDGAGFTQFIWHCQTNDPTDPEQQNFINKIRNNITERMVFTNVPTPMQLVDDIRASFEIQTKPKMDTKDAEVFFISNQMDEVDTEEITDLLGDVVDIHSLVVSQDSDIDYGELTVQQMKKSKLAVVYFKEASDWAIPFIQQVWKMAGGASSTTPLLLIGDDGLESNVNLEFKAPKVVSKVVAGDLVALEVKATYDKALANSI